ncbi:TY1B-JR1, partial [Symbiodinium necroappetens]
MFGGIVWNLANILLCKGIGMMGNAIGFPLCVGLGMVTGAVVAYVQDPKSDLKFLVPGVFLALCAISTVGLLSYRKDQEGFRRADSSDESEVDGTVSQLVTPSGRAEAVAPVEPMEAAAPPAGPAAGHSGSLPEAAAASSQALVALDPEEERKADEENDILQRRIEALAQKLDPEKKKPRSSSASEDSDSSASASSRPVQTSAKRRRRASRDDEALQQPPGRVGRTTPDTCPVLQPVTPIATPPEKEAEAQPASNAESPSAEPSAVDFWRRMKSGDIHPADLRDGVQALLQGNSLLLQEEPGSAGQVSLSMVVPALGLRVTTPVPQKLHATAEGRAMAEQLLSAMLLVQL